MNPSRQSSVESNLNNGKGNSTSIFLNENVRNISQTMVSDDEDDEDLVCLAFLIYPIYTKMRMLRFSDVLTERNASFF